MSFPLGGNFELSQKGITMNRKQWVLTVCCFLILCGSLLFSISGIKFSAGGSAFTAANTPEATFDQFTVS